MPSHSLTFSLFVFFVTGRFVQPTNTPGKTRVLFAPRFLFSPTAPAFFSTGNVRSGLCYRGVPILLRLFSSLFFTPPFLVFSIPLFFSLYYSPPTPLIARRTRGVSTRLSATLIVEGECLRPRTLTAFSLFCVFGLNRKLYRGSSCADFCELCVRAPLGEDLIAWDNSALSSDPLCLPPSAL